jgi:NAD(P)-dependent dehydrogenase (short-subunit alcohol dehydrogenase family)
MARVFITGSSDGLGLAAARALLDEGHEVVLHARSRKRAAVLSDISPRAAGVAIGDLSSATDTRAVADQVNAIGRMDAVIHNAGVYLESARGSTPEGHATTLAVNLLAPYLLTGWIERPDRLVYMSSGMHREGGGDETFGDIDWNKRRWNASKAYSESKLYLVAFALAVARRWPNVLSNAVDPGWVATKMGGPNATDDLEEGHLTQTWLTVSSDPAAKTSGGYWHHRKRTKPAEQALDFDFRERLIAKLKELTGVAVL